MNIKETVGIARFTRDASLRFLSLHPLRLEVSISEPLNRAEHGMNGLLHMREIEMGYVITGAVVVRVEAKAGDGLGDNSFPGESVIV